MRRFLLVIPVVIACAGGLLGTAPVAAAGTCNGLPTTINSTTGGNDDITGTAGNDVVDLQDGNDTFHGGAGNDTICGGDGNDRLYGEGDDDTEFGGNGNDDLDTTCTRDGAGMFTGCLANPGDGPGNDTLNGDAGLDALMAGTGHDTLNGGTEADFLTADTSFGDAVGDNLNGGEGDDFAEGGSSGSVTIDGGPGKDRLSGGAVGDTIHGGDGDDTIDGNTGNDTINGDAGADRLDGQEGNDTVNGGADADLIDGTLGNDTLDGGTGGTGSASDQLAYSSIPGSFEMPPAPSPINLNVAAGTATDTDGTDTFSNFEIYQGTELGDTMNGDDNDNYFMGMDGADTMNGAGGKDHIDGYGGADTIHGGADDDAITGDTATANDDHLFGDGGQDYISGWLGNDDMHGGDEDDRLVNGPGDDVLDGGPGADELQNIGLGAATVDLAAGTSLGPLPGGAGNSFPASGTDTLTGIENVYGGGLGDTIRGDDGPNVLNGGAGDGADHIEGRGGADSIDGGDGDDVLDGGAGPDTVDGRCGADQVGGGPGDDLLHGDNGDFYILIPLSCQPSADAFDGGPDTDTLEFPQILFGTQGVTVDLAAGTASGEGNDTVANVENANGTPLADTLKGTNGVNHLSSFEGDDLVDGRGGADVEDCGPGLNDTGYTDVLGDSLIGCENVIQGATPIPDPPAPPPTPPVSTASTATTPPPIIPPAPVDPTVGAPTGCLSIPSVARDRSVKAPGGGKVTLVTRQVDDAASPVKATVKGSGGASVRSVAFTVNGRPLATAAAGAVPTARLKIGSRANSVVATVTLKNGKKVKVKQLLVILRCPLPATSCKRGAGGRSLTCSSKTPLGARRVRVTVLGLGGLTATGSAAVKKGRYTVTVRSAKPLAAGHYLFKHVATTARKGEKLFMVRSITVA